MKSHTVNSLDNFILGWYIDPKVCDDVIEFFKKSDKKHQGGFNSAKQGELIVDQSKKDSIDCPFIGDDVLCNRYLFELKKCLDLYRAKYTYCEDTAPWNIHQIPNVQYYAPAGGYFMWHTERKNGLEPDVSRHLVFTTYLNDVTDAGETEFFYQKIKIKPEKGLTIIWPTDWTFTHRGIPSPTQEKYILTGWFNFSRMVNQ